MKALICMVSVAVPSLAFAAAGEDFDGSRTMICEPLQGHDCLPTEAACKPLKPRGTADMNLTINVTKKTVKSPYRNDLLTIQHVANNTRSLVLQGTSVEVVWSATVHRKTGRLTIAIADREGAYVVFGQCKLDNTGDTAGRRSK